jgi:hypothetical protein
MVFEHQLDRAHLGKSDRSFAIEAKKRFTAP